MQIRILFCIFFLLGVTPSTFAQVVLTNSYTTPGACGGGSPHTGAPIQLCNSNTNYVLGGNLGGTTTNGVEISGSNVTIDLAGYSITGGASNCTPSYTSPYGNSCTGAGGSLYGLYVTGNNVTVKNGHVSNINGTCVGLLGDGGSITDVSVRSCHGEGIVLIGTGKNLTADANLGDGISVSIGSVDSSSASSNALSGFQSGSFQNLISNSSAFYNRFSGVQLSVGQVNNVTSNFNGTTGITVGVGTVLNSTASNNVGAGVDYSSGGIGAAINSTAIFNGTYGFNLSTTSCYLNVVTSGNTSGSINGGNAFAAGGVCAH